ncbi:MAG: SSS family transporter [Limisphaerales bacterium]|jgi:SSS family solute:Na+ symporter
MKYFATPDWIVICVYLVGIIGLGVWLGRGQKNTRDYFLGGRNIPWWGVGLSIVATETSALTFIGVPAAAFGGDLAFIQIIIGYVIARVILAVVMVPHYFKGDIYSPYQLFENAFGGGAKKTVAVLFLVAGTLAAGVRVYATCIPIEIMLADVLPGNPIVVAILLFVGLSLIYTYFGGIRAVVWTDAIQFFLLVGGGIFAVWFLARMPEAGWTHLTEHGPEKFHWFNGGFSWSMPYNIWMGVIGATFQVMSSHGVDQLNVQRVLTCKSVSEGRKALALSAVVILPMFLLFLFVGALLWSYAQVHGLDLPVNDLGKVKNDYALPIFILTVMPAGMKGLLIVGILSAAMSSVSSALSALASVSTMDLVKREGLERSDDWYLKFSRRSTVAWAVILVLVALACQQVPSVLTVAFSLAGLTSGAMLGGLMLVLAWKQGRGEPVIYGMLVSLAAMIGVKVYTTIAWPWYTMIGCAVCILTAMIVREYAGGERTRQSG